MDIRQELNKRILIIDGAMGTMIQRYKLTEEDYRGERFKDWPSDIKGNNEVLSLTQPQIIGAIHREYLEAGADIIETNTFSATVIAQGEYGMQEFAYEQNVASARIARQATDEYTAKDPSKPRFVAGAIGPLNKTLSLSPDVNNPGFRALTFDEAMEWLLRAGKRIGGRRRSPAADRNHLRYPQFQSSHLCYQEILPRYQSAGTAHHDQRYHYRCIRQNPERTNTGSFLHVRDACKATQHRPQLRPGANDMRAHIEELSQIASCYTSAYPNAGLPNAMGEYDEQPEQTAHFIEEWAQQGFVNIVGGCCGTTPDHIRHIAEHVKAFKPRQLPVLEAAL